MSWAKAAVVVGLAAAALHTPDAGEEVELRLSRSAVERARICITGGLLLLALHRLYRLLFCPLVLLRTPDDVGYLPADGRSKAQAANEVRRRRKVGKLPPIYPNGWYRVLDSCMLGKAEVKSVSMLGQELAVFRGEDGKAYVLDAYCPHLGANLAVGGQVSGSCLECPFHGWQFRGGDGKCVKIPYSKKVLESAKVRSWICCEQNQQILVWFHCDGEEPEWSVPEQEEISNGSWVYRGRTEHFLSAHIEEVAENAGDVAHLYHLHVPGIVSGVDLRYINNKLWEFLRHDWKVEWEGNKPDKHCSEMTLKHSLTVFGSNCGLLDLTVVARQVGPSLVFLDFRHKFLGRGMILQSVTPVEPLLQCVTHTIYYQANIPAVVPKFLLRGECMQFERDVMIWNNKKYISNPLLVKEDATIRKHRLWYKQFYSENSPTFQYQNDTLDF
ncbi:Cholesterol desaturase daf-36 [Oryzias melastigma]|uniref:cholesterol 7-desaturase n=1 Tax=Oryzias melastigma TaxID=30732 RepID=A0A3B3DJE0_ORYME|nr:cholesterol 7-desaturase [Oryzias melastigma]KAF6715727.1 Cholesterol desaturase daf-36 [Oryzias melastigma]